jgi:hypothetical protein
MVVGRRNSKIRLTKNVRYVVYGRKPYKGEAGGDYN